MKLETDSTVLINNPVDLKDYPEGEVETSFGGSWLLVKSISHNDGRVTVRRRVFDLTTDS